jgi:uncharacterized membrane protein
MKKFSIFSLVNLCAFYSVLSTLWVLPAWPVSLIAGMSVWGLVGHAFAAYEVTRG